MRLRRLAPAGLVLALTIVAPVSARTVDVALCPDKATGRIAFDPAYLRLQTGDKLRFAAAGGDMLVASIKGMLPNGVAARRQKPGQALLVTLDMDGVYGFTCLPHYGDGVVALFVASKPANEVAAKSVQHPAAAARRFDELFARLDAGD